MKASCIVVDKPIAGINLPFNRCTKLTDVLAALVPGVDVYAVSGVYNATTESIVITLSNGSTFSIPAALLLPVVADGTTITGNGTTGNPLVGYTVAYDALTGDLTITPPGGVPVVVPAQTATDEAALDSGGLLGAPGAEVTTQALLDAIVNVLTNLPDPLPVAQITRTSKMGLTATYSAVGSSSTDMATTITLAWSGTPRAGTSGTATFAAPTALSSGVTFSAPGQYDISLTVTDSNGNTGTDTQTINVARVLEVAGSDGEINDYLADVSAAVAAINAQGTPTAGTPWQIVVANDVVDSAAGNVALPIYTSIVGVGMPKLTIANGALDIVMNSADSSVTLLYVDALSGVVIREGANNVQLRNLKITSTNAGISLVGGTGISGLLLDSIQIESQNTGIGLSGVTSGRMMNVHAACVSSGTGVNRLGINWGGTPDWDIVDSTFRGGAHTLLVGGNSQAYGIYYNNTLMVGSATRYFNVGVYANGLAAVVYAFDPDGITAFDGVNMLLRSADPATGLVLGGNAGNYRLVASVLMGSLAAGVTTIAGGNNTQLLV